MWIILSFLILFLPYLAQALDVELKPSYTEPVTKADGSTLDDLAGTRIYIQRADGSDWVIPIEIPATSLGGGGNIQTTATVTITDGQEEMGSVSVTAYDTSGNESTPISVPAMVDALAPGEVTGLSITTTVQ